MLYNIATLRREALQQQPTLFDVSGSGDTAHGAHLGHCMVSLYEDDDELKKQGTTDDDHPGLLTPKEQPLPWLGESETTENRDSVLLSAWWRYLATPSPAWRFPRSVPSTRFHASCEELLSPTAQCLGGLHSPGATYTCRAPLERSLPAPEDQDLQ